MSEGGVIPRGMWQCTPEHDLIRQPGIHLKLMMDRETYDAAFEWTDRQFHRDLRLALWHSHAEGCNSHWIFATTSQAILFKLRFGGRA